MTTDQKILGYLRAILLMLSITTICMLVCIQRIVPNPSRSEPNPGGMANQRNAALMDAIDNQAQEDSAQSTTTKRYVQAIFECTAYCPKACCTGKFCDGITASGHKIRPGDFFVAADKRYPFGTEMIIEGYNGGKPVKVLDRGGVIKGDRLDVFFPTHREALEWGRRHVEVQVERKKVAH